MRDVLHDEIDLAEQLRASARMRVNELWKQRLPELIEEAQAQSIDNAIMWALDQLMQEIGHSMDPLTTEAVKKFGALGKRRREVAGVV